LEVNKTKRRNKMARRTIDSAVKAAVLAAAQVEGAKLPEIAKANGISLPTVYNWLRAAKVVEVVPEVQA
jgi:transposase-like protein